jgi:predicted nuclease with TOPRIM domain
MNKKILFLMMLAAAGIFAESWGRMLDRWGRPIVPPKEFYKPPTAYEKAEERFKQFRGLPTYEHQSRYKHIKYILDIAPRDFLVEYEKQILDQINTLAEGIGLERRNHLQNEEREVEGKARKLSRLERYYKALEEKIKRLEGELKAFGEEPHKSRAKRFDLKKRKQFFDLKTALETDLFWAIKKKGKLEAELSKYRRPYRPSAYLRKVYYLSGQFFEIVKMVQSRIGAWHTKYKEACQKVFAKDFRMIRKLMKGYSDRSASKSVKNMYLAVAREMSSQIEGQINKLLMRGRLRNELLRELRDAKKVGEGPLSKRRRYGGGR